MKLNTLLQAKQGAEVTAGTLVRGYVAYDTFRTSECLLQSSIMDLVMHPDAIDDRKLLVSSVLMISNSTRISDNNLVA